MDDLVISASAGTGKTYQLARRYLQLLLLSGESPQNILATTFTRKAAGEIQNRILSILAKASENKVDFEALLAMLGENGAPAELTREQVLGALTPSACASSCLLFTTGSLLLCSFVSWNYFNHRNGIKWAVIWVLLLII